MAKSESAVAFGERCAETLRYVADNIDGYLPDEPLLDGAEMVVRVGDRSVLPTVELDVDMPACGRC